MRSPWVDVALLWVCMFGVWPLAHPEHSLDSMLGAFDMALHLAAWIVLMGRWKVVRR